MNQEINQKIEQLKQEIANLQPQTELAWQAFKELDDGEYARLRAAWLGMFNKLNKLKDAVTIMEGLNQ